MLVLAFLRFLLLNVNVTSSPVSLFQAQTTLTTNDIVISKLTQILSYLRQGTRHKKMKKKDKGNRCLLMVSRDSGARTDLSEGFSTFVVADGETSFAFLTS